MKLTELTLLFLFLLSFPIKAQWQPAGNKIKTKWAKEINPENVWQEYPRPQLVRSDWQNLNGLWDFALLPKGSATPTSFSKKILVPFAVESSLSGIQKAVGKENEIWYRRNFQVPAEWKGKKTILHFGAVDWRTEVWINDIKIGTHEGGYTPFSFDISPYLTKGEQKVLVKVWDPTNDGPQARGKQLKDPRGIWYTPVSGIWQTVWLEAVPQKYIKQLKLVPNIDTRHLQISADLTGEEFGDIIEATVKKDGETVQIAKAAVGQNFTISIPDAELWSPETPTLYDLTLRLISKGKQIDVIDSYFAMRKISYARDETGILRLQLNNKDYFQFGTLDQGWWPDGLYTAPTDEALAYDIKVTKELGFNMIRKHVKVEPARWYAHCDKLGMLVWQDMPNGDKNYIWQMRKYFDGTEFERDIASEKIYRKEWKAIMDYLYSHPSIVCWVPFNEGWGQFKTKEISAWTKNYDPSRLVNAASGGNHFQTGDILDLHNYPEPQLYLFDAKRPTILGEYGGIGLALKGHLWEPDKNWGYVQFKTSEEVTTEYVKFIEILKKLVRSGFSGAIYTQTTDVEMEVNGLMTYDREIIKLNKEKVQKANTELINVINNRR